MSADPGMADAEYRATELLRQAGFDPDEDISHDMVVTLLAGMIAACRDLASESLESALRARWPPSNEGDEK